MNDEKFVIVSKTVVDQLKPLSPEIAALIFSEWDSETQASFFNQLAIEMGKYDADNQLWHVYHEECLTRAGKDIMSLIGAQNDV